MLKVWLTKDNQIIKFPSNKTLKAGHIVKSKDLVFLRPNHGVDARDFNKIIGKKITRNTKAFKKLSLKNG